MPSGHEHNQICGFRFMTNLYDETTSLSDGELFKKTFFFKKSKCDVHGNQMWFILRFLISREIYKSNGTFLWQSSERLLNNMIEYLEISMGICSQEIQLFASVTFKN